jgi:DNA-binding NarL/FixJ family response regulator
MSSTNFILAETNELCQLGLKCIIQDLFQSAEIHIAVSKSELQNRLQVNADAVIIINYISVSIHTIDEVIDLSANFPHSRWLFIGTTPEESFLMPLTASFGKANFVLKTNDWNVIGSAISATVQGKKYFCSEALEVIMDGHHHKIEKETKRNLLTTTEIELIQLFAFGKKAREIAELRKLIQHTVNTHRRNIFRKLDINNVQELIKFALKNGLLDLTEYYI